MASKRGRSARKNRRKKGKKGIGDFFIVLFAIILAFLILLGLVNIYKFLRASDRDPNNMYPIKGVDVSKYQLDINWQGLEDEGYRFAFIKATEGRNHVDRKFAENWEEAHKTNMKVGAYHFLSFDTDGREQAENFIKTVGHQEGMLPPVIDVEYYGDYITSHPMKQELWDVMDPMIEALEDEYHVKPIIYTSRNLYKKYIRKHYRKYDIWISTGDGIDETLPDGRDWLFCQYTFREHSPNVAGGKKYLDVNVFNGNEWSFDHLKTAK